MWSPIQVLTGSNLAWLWWSNVCPTWQDAVLILCITRSVRPFNWDPGIPKMAPHKIQKLFSLIFRTFQVFWITDLPRYTPEKRTIKKLYRPPTGEAAKLTDDVTQITSYCLIMFRHKPGLHTTSPATTKNPSLTNCSTTATFAMPMAHVTITMLKGRRSHLYTFRRG
jgi:hypothetical protein